MTESWAAEVAGFWMKQPPERWWKADPEFDAEVKERFLETWEQQRQRTAHSFLGSPEEALAAAILFDQFPRNMFRGHADSFATDHLALSIAAAAVDRGYDEQVDEKARVFLYMPFQHSERLEDQERSLLLFASLRDPEQIRYAKLHHDVIARFGRFPHRNAILGRTPRAAELADPDVVPW